jgi:hypothetical protein
MSLKIGMVCKSKRITAPFSHEHLKSILHYEPKTGKWKWLVGKRGISVGKKAGCSRGIYTTIGIGKKLYYASNLAWFWMTGEWPAVGVDHKNRNKHDDRWNNLRLATYSQNNTNIYNPRKNGLPRGVSKSRSKFTAQICINRKRTFLGRYNTLEEAEQAYLKASEFRKEFLPHK